MPSASVEAAGFSKFRHTERCYYLAEAPLYTFPQRKLIKPRPSAARLRPRWEAQREEIISPKDANRLPDFRYRQPWNRAQAK